MSQEDTITRLAKRSWSTPTIRRFSPRTQALVASMNLYSGKRTMFCDACFAEWPEGEEQAHRKDCRHLKDAP